MVIKIAMAAVCFWWVFFILALMFCNYAKILQWLSTYDGSYWWIWCIIGVIFGCLRCFAVGINIQ